MPDFLKGQYATADMFSGTDESVQCLSMLIGADETGETKREAISLLDSPELSTLRPNPLASG